LDRSFQDFCLFCALPCSGHVRRLPPSPAPRALRLCLMPHMPYLPLRHRAIRHFSPRGQPPSFTPLGLASVRLVPVLGLPLPRRTLRFSFLSDDKPLRSPQQVFFCFRCIVSRHSSLFLWFPPSESVVICYLLSASPPPVCLSLDRFVLKVHHMQLPRISRSRRPSLRFATAGAYFPPSEPHLPPAHTQYAPNPLFRVAPPHMRPLGMASHVGARPPLSFLTPLCGCTTRPSDPVACPAPHQPSRP